ncbi:MAG: ABC transporter permease [Theionarchaea archaeon]|nr:ABC transporter permease [Theionarchaea archaeon]
MRLMALFIALTKNWLRSKSGIFFSFLFPVMLLIIFSTVFGGGGDVHYKLFVQNHDTVEGTPTELSTSFIHALESSEVFSIQHLDPQIDIAAYIKDHPSFDFSYRVLIIPRGFQENALKKSMTVRMEVVLDTINLMETQYAPFMSQEELQMVKAGKTAIISISNTLSGEPPDLVLLTDEADSSSPALAGVIRSIVNSFSNTLVGAEEVVTLSGGSLEQRPLRPVDYYVPGFIAAFIMTNGIIGATSTISEYRRNGQVKRLAATPLPKSSWILGNVLQQTLLAFILTGIMIFLGWILFDVTILPDIYTLLLIFLGAIAFCTVGMVLGGIIKDVEAASGAGNAIAFPMMFLSGAFWPLEFMPDYLQTIAKFLPLHYFHDGLMQLMIYETPANSLRAFIIIGIFGAVFLLIAVKITKWKEL